MDINDDFDSGKGERVFPIFDSSDQQGINAAFERTGTFQVKFKFDPLPDDIKTFFTPHDQRDNPQSP